MILRALAVAAVLAAALAAPAHACSPAPGWPAKARLSPAAAARTLAAAATYIDLAKVEALSDDFEIGTRTPDSWTAWFTEGPDVPTAPRALAMAREEWADSGVRGRYRVIERLKGASPDRFFLNGERLPPPPMGWAKTYPGLDELKYFLDQQDLAAWPHPGACDTPLFPAEGETYLVFRDAAGHLLRQPVSVAFAGRKSQSQGPAHVPVSGPDSAWVRLVRKVLSRSERP